MRRMILPSTLLAFAALPSAAAAQEAATRNVNDYLCTFAGKCGEESEPAETKEAPETKGFSLSRPARPASQDASKKSPDTKGFSLARPAPKPAAATPSKPIRTAAPARTPAAKPARKAVTAAAPAPAAKPAKAVATGRADLRLTFEKGSDMLTPQAREEARVFAQSLLLPELADKRFVIEGHTDKAGGRELNLELSRRRAQSVADYLTSLGVPASRLEVKGYGFDRPLEGRAATSQENRRVEAVLAS